MVIALMLNQGNVKLEFTVEGLGTRPSIAVDKITGIGNWVAVLAQQPLVDLQLSLVTGMSVLVKCSDRFLL